MTDKTSVVIINPSSQRTDKHFFMTVTLHIDLFKNIQHSHSYYKHIVIDARHALYIINIINISHTLLYKYILQIKTESRRQVPIIPKKKINLNVLLFLIATLRK